ncbi:MAG: translation elongation factor Ts [Paludibacteraceae bacterium]|nr:translation elongation factor Ts [Paludibacteraceae bacterium]
MAVSMADISKLRTMTGAGMMDCKKALTEAEGNFDKAVELIRKRGQAIAAKRSDRDAAQGCVLAAANGDFAAIVALKCETDFVAKNADFIALTKQILDKAMEVKPASLEDLNSLMIGNSTIQQLITDRSGVTGEKMELGAYEFVNGAATVAYVHPGNMLATVSAFNEAGIDNQVYKDIAMQVAAMNPIAVDEAGVPADYVAKEREIAVEKTKAELVQKQVDNALSKAGINPSHVDSDAHIESNMEKGWITAEQAAKAREIKETVGAQALANLKQPMIDGIVNGRIQKIYKEQTLLNQAFVKEPKMTVAQYLASASKSMTCTSFKRFTLNQE